MKRKFSWLAYCLIGIMAIGAIVALAGCPEDVGPGTGTGTGTDPDEYTVTINPNIQNGTVTANPTSGVQGTSITITATPADGYRLKAGSLKRGASLSAMTTTINNNKFSMPNRDVFVTAIFEQGAGGNPEDPLPPIPDFNTWASDSYNVQYRVFPNAPVGNEIVTYPWGSGTNNYFDQNAPVSYWNGKHIHKYPDVFHFANGRPVRNIADFELRQEEIFNIIQYYWHGRMPSIDPSVVEITWTDSGNNSNITVRHLETNRTTNINVSVSVGTGVAAEGSGEGILAFGVGGAPSARARQSTANFSVSGTVWGGNENNRSGQVVTLYGLTASADDTPSANMSFAWAMSVILTAIENGAFRGRYDPNKVTIYGFSRYGKAAMCIGAFSQGRGGSRIGATFIGSAGSGGPVVDRFIPSAGYLNHTEDPLPWDADTSNPGAIRYEDLKGIIWYQRNLSGVTVDGISIATSGAGTADRQVIRGWTSETQGVLPSSIIYDETVDNTWNTFATTDFGWIQNLTQARHETPGWFSARFNTFTDLHDGLDLDHDHTTTNPNLNRGKEGIACSLPADSHYISALIAPNIVYYEDGYDTERNNPEGQWANWLLSDEIYQMYADELNDPRIIWRNAIKMYHIPHQHNSYQTADETALIDNLWDESKSEADLKAALMKLRIPPFPVDDPRYRWDFNRMDVGRPGHPTIAERVYKMRNSPVPVKAMDWRGLLDDPEPLE